MTTIGRICRDGRLLRSTIDKITKGGYDMEQGVIKCPTCDEVNMNRTKKDDISFSDALLLLGSLLAGGWVLFKINDFLSKYIPSVYYCPRCHIKIDKFRLQCSNCQKNIDWSNERY